MTTQGLVLEKNIEETEMMDTPKTPDFKAPAKFKDAPEEWKSAGFSQYIPFTSTKYDNESFLESKAQWDVYSERYMAETAKERYTRDTEAEETLRALQDLRLTYGTPHFTRAPETARSLNEDLPQVTLDESFVLRLEDRLAKNPNSDINSARQYNLAKTQDAKFSNEERHPSELFGTRIKHGDELRKKIYEKGQVLADSGASVSKDAKTGQEIMDGITSQFFQNRKPIINAFSNTIRNNWQIENAKRNNAFTTEQMKKIEEASKIRENKPTSFSAAVKRPKP